MMNIEQLITKLQEIKQQHGNLPVGFQDSEFGFYSYTDSVQVVNRGKDDDNELQEVFVAITNESLLRYFLN